MITPSASRSSSYLDSFESGGGYNSAAKPGSAGAGSGRSDKGSFFITGHNPSYNQSQVQQSPRWSPAPPGTSSGRGGSSGGARTTTTQTIRKGSAPEAPDLPTFKAPEMDKRAVRALTQKMAAPGVRTLRESVQQAMGKNYENPNVRKMTLREALQGYGTGLEKVMSGASREARSEHMAELNLKREEEAMNFKAQTEKAMQSYQNAWADYLRGEKTVTESSPGTESNNIQYGRSPFGGITSYSPASGGRMVPTMTSRFI